MSAAEDSTQVAATVTVERNGAVGVIRINRPRLNVLSSEVLDGLSVALAELSEDLPGALVVFGNEEVFAAGADVSELANSKAAAALSDRFRATFDALAAFPRATIAAIAGYALGGGCELALACDFRLAAENARIGLPEVGLGMFPGAGGTQRLSRLIGVARTKELVFSGRPVNATRAFEIGLVTKVVETGSLLDAALSFAGELAAGPVVAHGLAKKAIDAGVALPIAEGLDLERAMFDAVLATEDAGSGVASFLANGPGKATFVGR